jgi:Phage tail protein
MASQVDQIKWFDPDGQVYPLTGRADLLVLYEREGFFMPPFSYVENETPMDEACAAGTPKRVGKDIQRINVDPREIRMRLAIVGTDPADVRQKYRMWCDAFNPLRGQGQLEVTAPDGAVRFLNCRYIGGLEGKETKTTSGRTFQIESLFLKAFQDPYWNALNTSTITLTSSQQVATFFPLFPLTLSSYGVFAETTINNNGELAAYPVWKIYGPAKNIKLNNLTTGEFLNIISSNGTTNLLDPGAYLTIDTTPGAYRIRTNTGKDLWANRVMTSTMWALQPGENKIRIEIDTSTSETKVELSWQTKHLTI